jgi:FkbM family methyltransferase
MQLSARTLPIAHALRLAGHILPVRGWDRVFRVLFDPMAQRPFQFEISLFEGTFVGSADNYIDWYALMHGAYEAEDLHRMRAMLRDIPDAVVLDIGANVGHHSVALAGVAGRVHAFEPYPPRLEALRANVARNPHLPITIHPVALGDRDCNAPFRLPTTGEWAGVQFDPHGTLTFPMRNGDRYLRKYGIERVDLIKLDVDGNEIDILRGLTACIEVSRPIILVEGTLSALEPVRDLFREYHFTALRKSCNMICLPNKTPVSRRGR